MSYEREKPGCLGYILGLGALVVVDALWGMLADSQYNREEAAEYLRQAGYANVQHVDTDTWMVMFRGCGYDEAVGHEFTATGPTGVEADVRVCDNLLMGASIRQGG